MPDSRPLSHLRFGTAGHDDPPASSESSTPYPNRHLRLRRALRNTTDLARDIARESSTATEPPTPRHPFTGTLHRSRRRMRDARLDDDEGAGDSESEESGRRRAKRRKLDVDSPPAVNPPIVYGHYGQVEPGKLKMEIVSCDGGEHTDPRSPEVYLGAKNLLKIDKSVYCSDRSSAAVLLRHLDKTPFCLEKLHVVGPEHGFTAPVREGLVYIAMDVQDLQRYQDPPYHARRTGIHEPPYPPRRVIRASPERLTLSDALRDPEISAAAGDTHNTPGLDHIISEDPYGADFAFPHEEPETHCDVPPSPDDEDATPSPEDQSVPVTLVSDEEPGDEDSSTQEVLDYRLQRLRFMRRRAEIDNWDRGERWSGISNLHLDESQRDQGRERADNPWSLSRLEALMSRRPVPTATPDDSLRLPPTTTSSSVHAPATNTAYPGTENGSDDPNVTVARFRIKRGKFKVTIKFDPPVSGRYLLLKMWAGRSNVDVQSVIAKGYGGQRFFPAVSVL